MSNDTPLELAVTAERLTTFIETVKTITPEATLYFEDHGIYTQPTDPTTAAAVNETLHADAMEYYESDGYEVGFNLGKFHDYVSKAESDAIVHVELDPETRKFDIDIGSASFNMAGINPDSVRDGTSLDDIDAHDLVTTDSIVEGEAFKHAVDVCGMVSDHLTVVSDEDSDLRFEATGDVDDVTIPFENSVESVSMDAEAQSHYSIEFLEELTSVIPKEIVIEFGYGDDSPAIIEYEHPDYALDVAMMVAPRIQTR